MRPVYVFGVVQLVHGSLPSLHSNVLPASEDWKVKVAVVWSVSAGGPVRIVVWGAVVSTSTVQSCRVGLESVFPAVSTARTRKLCGPWLSPL